MYTRHEDNKTVTETIPALDFIQKLIVHIPEKHFKMLRYYGIYAKHHKQEKKLRKCISAKKQRFLRSIQDWQHSILLSFGYDPLCCSECGTSMLVLEVYHRFPSQTNGIFPDLCCRHCRVCRLSSFPSYSCLFLLFSDRIPYSSFSRNVCTFSFVTF